MKFSKNVSFVALYFIFLIGVPSPIKGSDGSALLSIEDLAHEKTDRERGPALSSAVNDPNPWESYNQWMCFAPDQVEIESVGVKYDVEWKQMPQITVTTSGQRFGVSPSADLHIDAEAVRKDWEELLKGSREICLYAAFLQYLETYDDKVVDGLWVLEDLKTEKGYWHVAEANVHSLASPDSDQELSEPASDDEAEFDTVN